MLDNNKMNIHSAKRFIHYEKPFLCCTILLRSLSLFFDAQHLFSFFLAMLVCVLIVCAQFVSCFVRGRKREKDCVFGKNMNAHLSWCAFFAHGDLLLGICVHQYPCLGVNVLVSIPSLLAHKMWQEKRPTAVRIWTFAITMCRREKNLRHEEKSKQTNKRTEWTKLCLSLMVLFWWSSENHIAFSHWMDRSASSFVAFYSLFLLFGTCLHSIYTWLAVIHRRRRHRHRRRHHQRCFYSTTIQH